eukprot:Phypoly_transcript_05226.p1 GENE.Phypoly_transcript_05226~~Phypoly_transcript_05226.p1  ORF type:complete len:623 (+),score=105.55 Phypoly_transcript_05226:58-1926(+)
MDEDSMPCCPVCMDVFKDPRLLQCGHCICFDCVARMRLHHGLISCPMCKKEFPCPSFDSLPKNYSLMETIDMLKNMQVAKESQKKKCGTHQGQELDLVCLTCNDLPVCAKCLLVGTHKGHEHLPVEEYDATMKKKAILRAKKSTLTSRLKPMAECYDSLQNNINQLITRLQESTIDIEVQKQLFTAIESELKNASETEIDALEKTIHDIETRIAQITEHHTTALSAINAHFRKVSTEADTFLKLVQPPAPAHSPAPPSLPSPPSPSPSSRAPMSPPSPSLFVPHVQVRDTSSPPPPSVSHATSPAPSPAHVPNPNSNNVAPSSSSGNASSSAPAPADNGEQLFIVGGFNVSSFNTVLVHRQGSWSEIAPLSVARTNVSAVFQGSSLYVVGGVDETGALNTMLKYDLSERIWRTMPSLSYKRSALSSVVFNGHIWAIGGSDGENSMETVEIFNLTQKRWNRSTNLPYKRNFHASAVTEEAGGFIFTLGGSVGMERTKTAATCDREGRWTQIAPMNTLRSGLASVAIGKSIYALGGFDGKQRLSSVEVYRMDEGRWTPLPPMALPRSWFGAVTMADGNIYALGGYDGKTRAKSVEVFDPRAGRWELSQDLSLPYPVSGFGCAKS